MKYVFIILAFAATACSSPDTSEPADTDGLRADDAGTADDTSNGDVGSSADAEATDDSGAGADVGNAPCDVTLEVQEGVALASTQAEPVDAGTQPIICWTLDEGATQPGDEGWHLRVEREENAGNEMTEWEARGLGSNLRQVRFGDCVGEATCTEPTTLTAGSHFFSVWDEAEPERVGGTVVVTVQ